MLGQSPALGARSRGRPKKRPGRDRVAMECPPCPASHLMRLGRAESSAAGPEAGRFFGRAPHWRETQQNLSSGHDAMSANTKTTDDRVFIPSPGGDLPPGSRAQPGKSLPGAGARPKSRGGSSDDRAGRGSDGSTGGDRAASAPYDRRGGSAWDRGGLRGRRWRHG